MKNKRFKDLSNNKIVQVTDHFEDIIILDGRSKIKFGQLMNPKLFEEYIDPNSFLQNESFLNNFSNQLKSIPLDDLKNRIPADEMGYEDETGLRPTMDESAVLPYDPEIEKQELLRKAQTMYKNSPSALMEKQMESIKGILAEDEIDEEIINIPQNTNPIETRQQVARQIIKEEIKSNIVMDPILEMFKNVKRNTNFKIEFTVENKIPRIDFIEMMEDSYNTSIIDFLSQEFTDEIVKDPTKIKDKIKSKLMDLVYPPDDVDKNKIINDR